MEYKAYVILEDPGWTFSSCTSRDFHICSQGITVGMLMV